MRSIAIVGPTASGKTALSLELSRRLGCLELVSIDAMAVYRGLDIGTAKPSSKEQRLACWHLIDIVDPKEEFSVAAFQRLAMEAIELIKGRGHEVALVGGSGLYHRAVIDRLELPPRFPEVAQRLWARADEPNGVARLYLELSELDPAAAKRIEPANARRIVRALEVTLGSRRPFSSFGPGLGTYAPSDHVLIGLRMPREVLEKRLEARLRRQLDDGFLGEIETLAARGPLSKTAAQAVGYKELLAHLRGELGLEQALEVILKRSKSLARRQQAWFGRDPRVHWLDASSPDLVELAMQKATTMVG